MPRPNNLVLLLVLTVSSVLGRPARAEVSFEISDSQIVINADDQAVATYVFADEKIPRPYFAHVKAPGNIQVTRPHPPVEGTDRTDHDTMHPGIWMAFGDLNGSDFWRNRATIVHHGFAVKPTGGPKQGSFTEIKHYLGVDGKLICQERFHCTFRVVSDGYLLEWDSTFSSDRPFTFGDQEEMGLGFRVATPISELEGGRLTDSEGRAGAKSVWSQSAEWCDYSGEIGDHTAGITLFCHPENFRASWMHARNYGFVAANLFGRKAMQKGETSKITVEPGSPLRLRYALLMHANPQGREPNRRRVLNDYLNTSAKTANQPNRNNRPNIVFLMSDDQCTYSLGAYGTPGVKTLNLDQLARDGMVFDNHYDTTAICMASRANVMTGMYEFKTGCNFEHGPLMAEHWRRAYPRLLRDNGYTTAFAGKFGFEVSERPGKKGVLPEDDFDMWGGGPGQTFFATAKNKSMAHYAKEFPHATRSYGAFGRDFIKKASQGDKPFCLSISFKAPHRPVSPDPIYDSIYEGHTFKKPANFGRQFGTHFSLQSRQGRQYERFHSWEYSTDYDGVMAKYHQLVYAIDVAVGMIRDALVENGVADNTVVIYTSDNGYMCGSHGYGSKVLPYEESSRVPLIVYDPRHPNSGKQLRCDALTGNVDFAPTMLELAGIPVPPNVDGKSLVSLYDNPANSIRESLPLINVWGPEAVHSLAIVTKNWKYIYWPYDKGNFEPTEELYDLASDPLELKNRVSDTSASQPRRQLQKLYDGMVATWKDEAVPYHDYQRFGSVFARKIGQP